MLVTNVDRIINLLRDNRQMSVQALAKELNSSTEQVEEIGRFLEEENIVTIKYRFLKPILVSNLAKTEKLREPSKKNVLSAVDLTYQEIEELISKVKYLLLINKVKLHFGSDDWNSVNDIYQNILQKYNSLSDISSRKRYYLEEKITFLRDSINSMMIGGLMKKSDDYIDRGDFALARSNNERITSLISNISNGKKRRELQQELDRYEKTIAEKEHDRMLKAQKKQKNKVEKPPEQKKDDGMIYDT